jgi:hypothetical protein
MKEIPTAQLSYAASDIVGGNFSFARGSDIARQPLCRDRMAPFCLRRSLQIHCSSLAPGTHCGVHSNHGLHFSDLIKST